MKWCETCGKAANDNDIICSDSNCRGHLGAQPKGKASASVSQEEIDEITKHVWKKIWKKHWLLIFGEFSVLAFLGFFGLLDIYREASHKVQDVIVTTITNEFQTDKIHATVSDVASNEAKGLLIAQVMPEVTNFEGQVGARLAEINDTANNVVSGLYSNMVFETFSGSDSNHIVKYTSDSNHDYVLIRLSFNPVPGSIQGAISGGGGLGIPQSFRTKISVYQNVFQFRLTDYDLASTSISVQYVKDNHDTNIIQQITAKNGIPFADGIPLQIQ